MIFLGIDFSIFTDVAHVLVKISEKYLGFLQYVL